MVRMSCNGCRILRKGCSESCVLRPCLQWIDGADAQGHATVFVAKFFGRAGLATFVSAVPEPERPALFRSLLFEACGRTINPVGGAVGLLWSGNWHLCQEAVDTVLRGGSPRPLTELDDAAIAAAAAAPGGESREVGDSRCWSLSSSPATVGLYGGIGSSEWGSFSSSPKKARKAAAVAELPSFDLDLCLEARPAGGAGKHRRPGTPSMTSEESVTTSAVDSVAGPGGNPRLLNLFH